MPSLLRDQAVQHLESVLPALLAVPIEGVSREEMDAFFRSEVGREIALDLIERRLAQAEDELLPLPPPLVPVRLQVRHYGVHKVKGERAVKFSYLVAGLADLLVRNGWRLLENSRASYLYAVPPASAAPARLASLDAELPEPEAFVAWADRVHAYYQRHPEALDRRGSEGQPEHVEEVGPGQAWIYRAAHTHSSTAMVQPLLGGEATPRTTQHHRDAELAWIAPGGLERVWSPTPQVRRAVASGADIQVEFKRPAPPAAAPPDATGATAAAPTAPSGVPFQGVSIKVVAPREVRVEAPKSEAFRRFARAFGARWQDTYWAFPIRGADTEQRVREGAIHCYGTDGATVPTVLLRIKITPLFIQENLYAWTSRTTGKKGWNLFLHKELALCSGGRVRLERGVRVHPSGSMGDEALVAAISDVQGGRPPAEVWLQVAVPQPLAVRLATEAPQDFLLEAVPA